MYNVYIETYGCSANQNSTEIMAGLLSRAGFNVVNNASIADIAVINTCIVKGPTEQRMANRIKKLSRFSKLVVAGCMPDYEAKKIRSIAPKAALLSTHHSRDIIKVVKALFENKKVELLGKNNEIKLCLPKHRQNKIIGITQISEGCSGNCAFCSVKIAKGQLFSYSADQIIKNVKQDLEAGCKEVWITSQDNAAYGLDRGKQNLPLILKKILNLPGRFFVRLGMMNPNTLLPIAKDILELYKHPKLFKFLHIPLESGSNRVLKAMNRKYKVSQFMKLIRQFKKEIPNLTLSTDIICGFPGERKTDFKATLNVIKKIKPDILNISRYWPMPGTSAASLKQLPAQEVKKRSNELMKLFTQIALAQNERWIDWQGSCLVSKQGWPGTWLARNSAYKLIVLKSKEKLLGKVLQVKVVKATPHYLLAEIKR